MVGLSPASVDRLWAHGLADYLVVEADGSRGLPFKAFGPHEPQVPSRDHDDRRRRRPGRSRGSALTEGHVHRADVLASILGDPARLGGHDASGG